MTTYTQPDCLIGYKEITTALVALYVTLLERDKREAHDPYVAEMTEIVGRLSPISKMATTAHKGTAVDVLYSIAAPGLGLCYCLTAVRHLYATAELCIDCPLCHGSRTVTEFYEFSGVTILKKCPCVTAVSAQLIIWRPVFQAALAAWMEWVGLDGDALDKKYGRETLEQNVLECVQWNVHCGL